MSRPAACDVAGRPMACQGPEARVLGPGRGLVAPLLVWTVLGSALGALSGGCDTPDGGIELVTTLPPPLGGDVAAPSDATPDAEDIGPDSELPPAVAPTVAFKAPGEGATVDGDWLVVAAEVGAFELGLAGDPSADGQLLFRVQAGETDLTQTVDTTQAVFTGVPKGPALLSLELVTREGEPIAPPVTAGLAVTVDRVVPALGVLEPEPGQAVYAVGDTQSVAVEVALEDFTLLPEGVPASGPRQGRVAWSVDGQAAGSLGEATGALDGLEPGERTLEVALVDADGVPWDPPVTSSVTFVVAPPPAVAILSPVNEAIVPGASLELSIGLEDFIADGLDLAGHGLVDVRVDGELVQTGIQTTGTLSLAGVPPGEHTIAVELTDAFGATLGAQATDDVTVTFTLVPPSIELAAPVGPALKEGFVTVAVVIDGYALTDTPLQGADGVVAGAWRVSVDGEPDGGLRYGPATQVLLSPGAHVLKVELVDTAGAPLSPSVSDSVVLEVFPVEPELTILSPTDGATVPTTFQVAALVTDFTLSEVILPPDATPDPAKGHFHLFVDGVYEGFATSSTFPVTLEQPGTYQLTVALHYQTHAPVAPAVSQTFTVTVDDTPSIAIVSPAEGETIGLGPNPITVAVQNFDLITPPSPPTPGEGQGHWHLFVDGVYQGFVTEETGLLPDLADGPHTLTVGLFNHNHTPVAGTVQDQVDIVVDTTPKVVVDMPWQGATVTLGPVDFSVSTENFTMTSAAGQEPVDGEGHIHVFVDGVYQTFSESPQFTLLGEDMGPGVHEVTVALHQNDHAPVPNAINDTVTLTVDPTPAVWFDEPLDGGFVYNGPFDAHLTLRNLELAAGEQFQLWLSGIQLYQGSDTTVPIPALALGETEAYTLPVSAAGVPLPDGAQTPVTFEVIAQPPPEVVIVSPSPGATVTAGDLVEVAAVGFTLLDVPLAGPAVPGEGAWMLHVGEQTLGPLYGPTVELPPVAEGALELRAELVHRDGSPVLPGGEATLTVEGDGAAVSLGVTSPAEGSVWYGPNIPVTFNLAGQAIGGGTAWIQVSVDGEAVGLWPGESGELPALEVGDHVIGATLLDASQVPVDPPVSATRSFLVGGTAIPTLDLVVPASGQTVSGANTPLEVVLGGGVSFDAAAAAVGEHVAGKVRVEVSVDDAFVGYLDDADGTLDLSSLNPGPHSLRLVLVNLNGKQVWPYVWLQTAFELN